MKARSLSKFSSQQIARFIVLFWSLGVMVELFLIGHYEDWIQYSPLIILGLGFVGYLLAIRVDALMICSVLTILTGLLGIVLHLRNNYAFEVEMYPHMSGWELFKESLTGALPVLAPGALIPIGLLGFLVIKLKN